MPDDIDPIPPRSSVPGEPSAPQPPVPNPPEGLVPPTTVPTPRREIVLNPKTAPRPAAPSKKAEDTKAPEEKDSVREVIETIVFVVVLVLLLKTFLAEAFVIPTGSMATTLLGYHRTVECPKCKYEYLVNASKEGDPQESRPQPVVSCTCPNCDYTYRLPWSGGDP